MLGFPCNQFMGQEPGTADEIKEFCETNYGVTFPLFEKIDVNGDDRHPLYDQLVEVPDADGHTGDIRWNFEKFLVARAARSSAGSTRWSTPTTRRWSTRSRPNSPPEPSGVAGVCETGFTTGSAPDGDEGYPGTWVGNRSEAHGSPPVT